jgi:hypothetical protein
VDLAKEAEVKAIFAEHAAKKAGGTATPPTPAPASSAVRMHLLGLVIDLSGKIMFFVRAGVRDIPHPVTVLTHRTCWGSSCTMPRTTTSWRPSGI